ncbi:melanocyte protein PMEL isoform X2 [Ambystoma mexicanum]|uniref:melanocyte protein PMEL isoform X2 n=1 Tax=Ambystoma mexicanum TaxID=8296 RepID=UPI0037E86968
MPAQCAEEGPAEEAGLIKGPGPAEARRGGWSIGRAAMQGLASWMVCWALLAVAAAQNRSRDRLRQNPELSQAEGGHRPTYRSWNTQLYPVWQEGAAQQRDCWKGGQVTFDVSNDAPTLIDAKATFSIKLNLPHNQTVLPDGQIVWGQNCTVNGTRVVSGEPVFPDETSEGSDCVFPDGQRFPQGSEKRRSKFVYVWQTWGKYWQVVDGSSSHLTVDTHGVPLGSYTMEVVVYHYRGRQKFIPMGRVTSQFTITDQIPFSVSISQIMDLDQADSRFVQNRAIAFNLKLHDPSQYLKDADISYSWDFGDQSGTLISQSTAVTHTYVAVGAFRPQVIVQAAIPLTACGSTVDMPTTGAAEEPTTGAPEEPATTPSAGDPTTTGAPEEPATTPSAGDATTTGAAEEPATTPFAGAVTATAGEGTTETVTNRPTTLAPEPQAPTTASGSTAAPSVPGSLPTNLVSTASATSDVATPAVVTPAAATIPAEAALAVEPEASQPPAVMATASSVANAESVPATLSMDVTDADIAAAPVEPESTPVVEVPPDAVTILQASLTEASAVNTALLESTAEGPVATSVAVSLAVLSGTEAEPEVLDDGIVLVKRQALQNQPNDCLLYRYGSFSTDLDIVRGIESVEIAQVVPAVAMEGQENVVDFTVTCQGSVPSDVCTTISDPDCLVPQQTICSPVPPSSDCQMVLRQLFNGSGDYCVNVSLTNAVSLAVASAQVRINGGGGSTATTGLAVFVGVLVLGLVLGAVAYTYRHVKQYTLLASGPAQVTGSRWVPDRSSLRIFFRNALGRTLSGESSPLLSGNVV